MALPPDILNRIKWAGHHFDILRAERDRYFKDPANYIFAYAGPDASAVLTNPLPWNFPHVIGDCLHSVRCSLDYLIAALCRRFNVDPTNEHAFPICKNAGKFEKTGRKRLADLPEEVITAVERTQPYHCGQKWNVSYLWALNELCNADKHRGILLSETTVVNAHADMVTASIGHQETNVSGVDVESDLVASIAFKEGVWKGRDVCWHLGRLIQYIAWEVLPRFEEFF